MAKPYQLQLYAQNTSQVLQRFATDEELFTKLTQRQAWALGKAEGAIELLFVELASANQPSDEPITDKSTAAVVSGGEVDFDKSELPKAADWEEKP